MIQIAAGLFYGLIYGIIVTYIVDKMVEPYKYIKFIIGLIIIAILGLNYTALTKLIYGTTSNTTDLVALVTLIYTIFLHVTSKKSK
jgi:hypothetical protein